jgi:hypothetical protein
MLIEPNGQGWSSSSLELWHLLFNDQYIIKLFPNESGTSTQEKLFVGTKEECEAKIAELGLPLVNKDALGVVEEEMTIVPPPQE